MNNPARSSNLLPHDGQAYLYPQAFGPADSDRLLATLQDAIAWKQEPITIFGKAVMQPRLTAWYADAGKAYTYSGHTMQPLAWTPELLHIKENLENLTGHQFNSCLLNLYRHGQDSMGWHRDNERELGPEPSIASVSFGASRLFKFRNYLDKKEVIRVTLEHGSLLLMTGVTQTFWQHGLPKSAVIKGLRINLTFRLIV